MCAWSVAAPMSSAAATIAIAMARLTSMRGT